MQSEFGTVGKRERSDGGRWGALTQIGRWRIDPGRRGAAAVMAAILVAALAVGWQALASRPHAEPVSDTAVSASVGTGAAASSGSPGVGSSATSAATGVIVATAATKVIVDVVGRVRRPGLVTLAVGARVADAVRAAGGALARTNLSTINLARVCVDGEQIAVGVSGAAVPAGTATQGSAPGSGAPAGLVNLNTATADQLDALPGVGPVMAQRIIAYRTDHGPFTAVVQLQQVSGIGVAKYADLSPLVTV
jgi:competence protein ComEA